MDDYYEPHWTNYLKQFDLPPSHFQDIPGNNLVGVLSLKKDPLLIQIKNFMFLLEIFKRI